jgi:protein-tyrosine kinase
MASLIELAAQRLEQLRATGLAAPTSAPAVVAPAPTAADAALPAAVNAPEAAISLEPAGPAPVSRRIELDLERMRAAGVVTPDQERSAIADQYRVIKRPLLRNAQALRAAGNAHGNLIMVTSAMPGEGKTFTAVNLAMSMAAEIDHTVMLVDADVARPSVPRMLGFDPDRGLLDVLEGEAELPDVLLRTSVDKLVVLPSGRPRARANELLASESMRNLVDQMARRYPDRVIVFDSPPLLLTTESRVLATHMGQIVVVVQAERTTQAAVQRALATIESHPLRTLVLNQSRGESERSTGYSYDYRYGYAGDAGRPTDAR